MIEFTPYVYLDEDNMEQLPTAWWVLKNLEEDGIEKRLEKVLNLVALMAPDWLDRHPEHVGEVAYAIGCRGRDHKIIKG